jgi:hypothetical protein
MMRKYSHAAIVKRVVHCLRKTLRAKLALDARMDQDVNRAGKAQRRKALARYAHGLALINQRHGRMLGCISDRRGLTVIQGHDGGPDHKILKVLDSSVAETDDTYHPAFNELTEAIRVPAAARAAGFEFGGYGIDNDDAVGQCRGNLRGAAGRDQVDDRAGVGHKVGGGISQRG